MFYLLFCVLSSLRERYFSWIVAWKPATAGAQAGDTLQGSHRWLAPRPCPPSQELGCSVWPLLSIVFKIYFVCLEGELERKWERKRKSSCTRWWSTVQVTRTGPGQAENLPGSPMWKPETTFSPPSAFSWVCEAGSCMGSGAAQQQSYLLHNDSAASNDGVLTTMLNACSLSTFRSYHCPQEWKLHHNAVGVQFLK